MKLTVTHDETRAVVTAVGAMDADSAYDVYLAVAHEAEAGHNTVALDLAGVDFIDSIGLGMLIRCRDELRNNLESRLTLHNPSHQVQRMLDLTALRAQFDVDQAGGNTNS